MTLSVVCALLLIPGLEQRAQARANNSRTLWDRKNLARAVKTRTELTEQIRDTLLHEIGHLEGLDEDDLRRRGME